MVNIAPILHSPEDIFLTGVERRPIWRFHRRQGPAFAIGFGRAMRALSLQYIFINILYNGRPSRPPSANHDVEILWAKMFRSYGY